MDVYVERYKELALIGFEIDQYQELRQELLSIA
jgi:hypothetical protein